jgi:hypothetical protein
VAVHRAPRHRPGELPRRDRAAAAGVTVCRCRPGSLFSLGRGARR